MANDDLDFIDINNNINDIGGNDDIIFDSKNKGVFKKISYATSKLSAAISDVYETVDEEAEIEEARIAATILSGGSPLIAHFLEKGIQKYVPKLKNSVLMLKRKASDYIFKKKKIDEYDKELDNISKSDIDQDEFENKLGKLTDKFEELKVSKSTKRPGRRKTVTNLKIEKPIVKRYETSGLDKIEKSQTFNLNEMFEIRRNKLSGPTSFKRLIAKNNKYPFGDFIANKLGEINESIIDVGNKFSDLKDILLKSKDKIVNKKIDKERATTSNQMLESLNKIYDAINKLPKKTSMDQTENFSAVATAARTNLTAQSGMFVRQSILKKSMMTPGLVIPGAKNGLISGSEFQGFLTAQVVQQLYWLNKAMGKFFGAKEPMFVDYLASGYETAMIAVSARLPIIKQLNHIVGFSMAIAKQLNRVGKILYSPIKLLLPGKRLKYSKEISMKSTPMETLVDIGMYQYNKLSMLYDLMARVYPKKSKDIRDKEWFSRIPGITPLASGMMGIAKYLFGEKQEKKKGSGLLDSIRNIPKSIKGFFLGSETSRTKSFSELSVRNKQLQIQYNSLMHLSSIDSHIKELVKSNIPGLKVKPEEYDDIRKYLEQEKTLKFKKGPSRLGAATMKVVSPIASVSSKLVSFMQKSRTITPQYDENRKTKSILTEEEKRKAEDAKIKIGVLKRTKEWFSKPTVMGNSVLLGLSLLNPIAYTAINSIWAMGLLGQFTGIKEFKVFDDLYNETAIMTGIHTKKLLSLVSDTPSKLKNLFNFKLRKPRKFNFVEKTTDGKKLSKADKLLTAIKENTKALPKRIADASRVAMGGIGAYAIYKVMGSMKSIFGNTPMAKSWVTISGGIAAYLATKDIGAALNVLQIGAIGGGLLFIFEKLKPLLGSKGALVATGAVGVGGAIATGMIGKKVLTTIGGWIGGLFAGSGIASTVTSGISAAGGVLLSGPALIALAVGGSVAGLAYYMKHKSEKDAEREIKRAKQDSEDRNKLLGVNQELLKQFGKQEGKYKISSIAAKAGIRSERTTTNLKELLSEKEEKRKGIIGKTLFRYRYNKEIKEILGEIEKSETSTKS
ncbi:hypothetical protein M0R36_10920, partial [bacterium]|nr:hypothetical protein [bacterium]